MNSMKVFITSAYPYHADKNFTTSYLRESAQIDHFKVHSLTEDPEEADIIIFAERQQGEDPFYFEVTRNEIYKCYKHKSYLYHDYFLTINRIQTITPVLEAKYYDPIFNQPFSYISGWISGKTVQPATENQQKDFLFSFVGTKNTHPLRNKLFEIQRIGCYISDTSAIQPWQLSEAEFKEYEEHYYSISLRSKFILCPRGLSANSYRLYESMEMGVAPVIISDEWVPTVGPQWQDFSIQIPEAAVDEIPRILEQRAADALRMGKLARQAWEEWFARDKQFHYLTEACLKLHATRSQVNWSTYLKQYRRMLEPEEAKNLLRHCKRKLFRLF
jgi:hypothetical protein